MIEEVERKPNESLFRLEALLAMCDLEAKLEAAAEYRGLCQTEISSKKCCRPWTIPNYIALLSNRSSCYDIQVSQLEFQSIAAALKTSLQADDVLDVTDLLVECHQHYSSMKLSNDCVNKRCQVPSECAQHNAVYNIFHYLADTEFVNVSLCTSPSALRENH